MLGKSQELFGGCAPLNHQVLKFIECRRIANLGIEKAHFAKNPFIIRSHQDCLAHEGNRFWGIAFLRRRAGLLEKSHGPA